MPHTDIGQETTNLGWLTTTLPHRYWQETLTLCGQPLPCHTPIPCGKHWLWVGNHYPATHRYYAGNTDRGWATTILPHTDTLQETLTVGGQHYPATHRYHAGNTDRGWATTILPHTDTRQETLWVGNHYPATLWVGNHYPATFRYHAGNTVVGGQPLPCHTLIPCRKHCRGWATTTLPHTDTVQETLTLGGQPLPCHTLILCRQPLLCHTPIPCRKHWPWVGNHYSATHWYRAGNTDRGWATTNLPHTDTWHWTFTAVVTS